MIKCFIGWDPKDALAFDVLVKSLHAHTSEPLEIIPIKDHELRWRKMYWRSYRVDKDGQCWDDRDGKPFSTAFSFTRFCVPLMNDFKDEWVIFMDSDMMFRRDIVQLYDEAPKSGIAVSCVQHQHEPVEDRKMGGLLQTLYARKNWSSLMVMNTARCKALDAYTVNNSPGSFLHAMNWVSDEEIGSLHEGWNWLDGWSDPKITPLNVHFTRGTPDMPGVDAAYAEEWLSYVEGAKVHEAA